MLADIEATGKLSLFTRLVSDFRKIATLPLCGCHRESHGSPLLKAFAAIHGTSLSGFEGDRSLLPALRADCFGFYSLNDARTIPVGRPSYRLAGLATFRFVLEALIGKKHLFAGCENELSSTIRTLQDPVVIFHTPLRTELGKDRQRHPPNLERSRTGQIHHRGVSTCWRHHGSRKGPSDLTA
jgi:hypothetical protein